MKHETTMQTQQIINTIITNYCNSLNGLIKNKNFEFRIFIWAAVKNDISELYQKNYIALKNFDGRTYPFGCTIMFFSDMIVMYITRMKDEPAISKHCFTYSNSINDIAVVISDELNKYDNNT